MFNDFEGNLNEGGWKLAQDWQIGDLVANPGEHDRQDRFATDVHGFLNAGESMGNPGGSPEAPANTIPGSPGTAAFGQSGQEPKPFDPGFAHGLQGFMKAGQMTGGGFGENPDHMDSGVSSHAQSGNVAENQTTSGGDPTSGQAGNPNGPVQTSAGGQVGSRIMAPVEYPIENRTGSATAPGGDAQAGADAQRALWEKMKGIDQGTKDYLGEQERQKQQRENWEKLKGLDPETQKMINGPQWPAQGKINSPFGKRTDPFTGETATHYGIDIKNAMGAAVAASQSGEVVNTSPGKKHGENQVHVRNKDGTISIYAHTKPSVNVGDHVYAGDKVGNTDRSGRTTGPHLHYGIIDSRTNKYIDPVTRLPKR